MTAHNAGWPFVELHGLKVRWDSLIFSQLLFFVAKAADKKYSELVDLCRSRGRMIAFDRLIGREIQEHYAEVMFSFRSIHSKFAELLDARSFASLDASE